MLSFKTDEKQSRKNLKIDKDGVAALRARHRQMNPGQMNLTQQLLMRHSQMNPMQMNPMRGGGNLSAPWGAQLAAGMIGQNQQNTQMGNPFYGGDLIVRQGQQNPPMGNPFFGPLLMSQGQMIGARSTKKGGGFTPGYDPWSLRINPKVAKKLEDQPVGLFF